MEEHGAHPGRGHGEPRAVQFPPFFKPPARWRKILSAGQLLRRGGAVGIAEMAKIFRGLGQNRWGLR